MKKYSIIILFVVLSFSLFAYPWGHRYATEQSWQNTTITKGSTLTFSVEWGEGDWTHSDLGYGTTTDGTGWTWVDIPWFEDGEGSNKRCKTNVTFNTAGTYYYAYRMEKPTGTYSYQHGSDQWSENSGTLSAVSYVTVEEPPTAVTLSSFMAAYLDGTPLISWTTQSESDNLGWNIYRNDIEDFEGSIKINAGLIPGAGTTSEQTDYQFTDYFPVNADQKYYYWIEEVSISGFSYHYGPISLTIPEHDGFNPTPPTSDNSIASIYNFPNPSQANTTIQFVVKEPGLADISIYNIKGQKIKTVFKEYIGGEKLNKSQSVFWDGKDEQGTPVADGIYLNVLKINGKTFTHNIILMK